MMVCNSLLAIRSPDKSSDFTGSLFDSLGLNIGILFNTKIASPFIMKSLETIHNEPCIESQSSKSAKIRKRIY